MLTPRDLGSRRNYAIYLVAKGLDLALFVMLLVILAPVAIVGFIAEAVLPVAGAIISAAHQVRRKVSHRLADVMCRFLTPEPTDTETRHD